MPAPGWVTAPLALIPSPTKAVVTSWADVNVTPAFTTVATTGTVSAALQAVLLVHRAIGAQEDAQMASRKGIVAGWSAQDLAAEKEAYVKAHQGFQIAKAGDVILMPSFRHANSVERNNAKDTVERAIKMLLKAYLAVKFAVKTAGDERTKAQTWFGAFDTTRFQTVAANLKKLHDAIATKPIRLYYRGPKTKGPEDKPRKSDAATPLGAFASAFTASSLPPYYDTKFGHVTLGNLFFNKTKTTTSSQDSIGGVLLHELSHHICDTDDVKRPDTHKETYGQDDCKWLATNHPPLAIKNADNYEYYCESFQ